MFRKQGWTHHHLPKAEAAAQALIRERSEPSCQGQQGMWKTPGRGKSLHLTATGRQPTLLNRLFFQCKHPLLTLTLSSPAGNWTAGCTDLGQCSKVTTDGGRSYHTFLGGCSGRPLGVLCWLVDLWWSRSSPEMDSPVSPPVTPSVSQRWKVDSAPPRGDTGSTYVS